MKKYHKINNFEDNSFLRADFIIKLLQWWAKCGIL